MNDNEKQSMWGTIFGTVTSAFRTINKVILSVEDMADYVGAETTLIKREAQITNAARIKAVEAALKD